MTTAVDVEEQSDLHGPEHVGQRPEDLLGGTCSQTCWVTPSIIDRGN